MGYFGLCGYGNAWQCCDCEWLDPSDRKWSLLYCQKKGDYVDPQSPACNDARLNRCEILDQLKMVKDLYTFFNPEAYAFMEPYQGVEDQVIDCLSEDEQQDSVLANLVNNFAKPAVDFIKNNNFDGAIKTYKNMLDDLIQKYGLSLENISLVKTPQRVL